MFTKTASQSIYPVEWVGSATPNYVIYATALITTGYLFSGLIKVTDVNGNDLGSLNLSSTSGFTSKYLGSISIPTPTEVNLVFPLTLSSDITCNIEFETITGNQHAAGTKTVGSTIVPICYETCLFCNDSGTDNDWNDCAISFQLYNASTD